MSDDQYVFMDVSRRNTFSSWNDQILFYIYIQKVVILMYVLGLGTWYILVVRGPSWSLSAIVFIFVLVFLAYMYLVLVVAPI